VADERIVAIGLLNRRDLEALGEAFTRHIPLTDDDMFADLLTRLDKVEAAPLGKGVVLTATKDGLENLS
jgi:hypothetical protein